MLPIKPAGLYSVTETHIVGKNPFLKVVLSPTRVPFYTYTHRGTYMLIILYSCLNCKTQKASAWKWQSAVVSDITLVQAPSPHHSRHRGKARGLMRLDRSTAPILGSCPLLEYLNHRVRNSDSLQRRSGWGTEDRREQTETCQQPCPWVQKQVLPTVVRQP